MPLDLTSATDMAKVRIYSGGGNVTGLPALSLDASDNPSIVFVQSDADANSTNCLYKFGKKNGATWGFHDIASADDILERSILINKTVTTYEAYLTREGTGTGTPYNFGGFIEKWVSSNDGVTWVKSKLVSNKSLFGFLQYVEDAHADIRFIFAEMSVNLNGNPYQSGTEVKVYAYGDSGFKGNFLSLVHDTSPNALHLTIPAVHPTSVAGKFGKGFSFPGGATLQHLLIADKANFTFVSGGADAARSITFWLKSDNTATGQFIISKEEGTNFEWRVDILNNVIRLLLFHTNAGAFIYATAPFTNTSDFIFVCFTYTGSENETGIKIYLNCIESQSVQTHSGTYTGMGDTTAKLFIGNAGNAGSELDGILDEVKIWDKVLSPTEMAAEMAGTL